MALKPSRKTVTTMAARSARVDGLVIGSSTAPQSRYQLWMAGAQSANQMKE